MLNRMLIIPLMLSACSTSPDKIMKYYEDDKTLSTLNGRSQPDWADESIPFKIEGGKVYSVGVTTIRGDQRPEAGARVAENNARANFAKSIENKMEFILQNSEENTSFDSTQTRYIGSEVSNLTSHSMRPEGSWWMRYAQSGDDGSRHIYYKIYSLVTMPEEDLKKAIDSAIKGKVADKKISEDFQDKVNQQWDRFVEAKTSKESE